MAKYGYKTTTKLSDDDDDDLSLVELDMSLTESTAKKGRVSKKVAPTNENTNSYKKYIESKHQVKKCIDYGKDSAVVVDDDDDDDDEVNVLEESEKENVIQFASGKKRAMAKSESTASIMLDDLTPKKTRCDEPTPSESEQYLVDRYDTDAPSHEKQQQEQQQKQALQLTMDQLIEMANGQNKEKSRTNIHKVMQFSELGKETLAANRAEKCRRQRVEFKNDVLYIYFFIILKFHSILFNNVSIKKSWSSRSPRSCQRKSYTRISCSTTT